MSNVEIIILGTIISILLAINAYFIKGLVESLKRFELELVKISTEHDRVIKDVRDLDKLMSTVRERVHKLEGHAFKFFEYLDSKNNN